MDKFTSLKRNICLASFPVLIAINGGYWLFSPYADTFMKISLPVVCLVLATFWLLIYMKRWIRFCELAVLVMFSIYHLFRVDASETGGKFFKERFGSDSPFHFVQKCRLYSSLIRIIIIVEGRNFRSRTTNRFSDESETSGRGKLKMNKFIVADQSGVHISCLRHGFKKDNLVCDSLHLKQGDLLTLKNRKKYIVDAGWFVLALINGHREEFVCAEELDKAVQNERIMNEMDCFLKLCSVSYYLDQALALRNKEEFIRLSAARNEWACLYEQLCGKVFVES